MIQYFLNCFLLLIPIFIWNILFYMSLPKSYSKEIFWNEIPKIVSISENVLRIFVFVLPVFMKISFETKSQMIGLGLYLFGIIVYFCSWLNVMYFHESKLSKSLPGFTAPAFTTIFWFTGIGLIGQTNFFEISYFSSIYFLFVILFVVIHTIHSYIVYSRF